MINYTCDKCKQLLNYPVYTLRVNYSPDATREQHFHWQCLREYMQEA